MRNGVPFGSERNRVSVADSPSLKKEWRRPLETWCYVAPQRIHPQSHPHMTRQGLRRSAIAVLALVSWDTKASAQPVPDWTLRGPRVEVGSPAVELHRVRGAGLLSDGRIAIADGGNARVVVASPAGAVEREFGRRGSGPGEFEMLYFLTAIGDTLVTWDSGTRRVALWKPDGTPIRSTALAAVTNLAVELKAVRTPTEYVAVLRTARMRPATGLYIDSATLIAIDARTGKHAEIETREWSYSYFNRSDRGTSTSATPFLGSTLLAGAAGKMTMLTLGSTSVHITRADGSRGATVQLPITAPSNTGARAKAYGDSLIRSAPNGGASWARRVEAMFSSNFPPAKQQARAQRAVTVGRSVWFQAYPEAADSLTSWLVVDVHEERLAGRVLLPRSANVLGGNDRQVLVLLRDEDGVESVALFDIVRGAH